MDKVVVQFLKGNGYYVSGDVTKMDREEAQKLALHRKVVILSGEAQTANPNKIQSTLPPVVNTKIICSICGKEFKNEQALRMHKLRAHQIK